MRRFFVAEIAGDTVHITGQEARHIARTLRMQAGDGLVLFDGSGYDFTARIEEIDGQNVRVHVLEKSLSASEPDVNVTLFQAVIKSDHLDFVTQKCTELGVSRIVPFLSARCVKRPDEAAAAKLAIRQRRIAMEAAKQCGRSKIPVVEEIIGIEEIPSLMGDFALLAYEDEKNVAIRQVLQHRKGCGCAVIIGPEGGFETSEAARLTQAGATACSLGKLVLRSETAGAAALAMILYENMEGGA